MHCQCHVTGQKGEQRHSPLTFAGFHNQFTLYYSGKTKTFPFIFIYLKGLCRDISSYFKSLKLSLNQWKPKNNYSVCLRETILQPRDCLLSPIVTDGKDGDGLQLEKVGQLFQVLTLN